MTVGSIQFDSIFSAADSLRVADVSGLAPLSFNPPSPESLGRFLSSMSDGKPEVDSIRLALDSIAQNMSSPHDVSKLVVTPVVPDSRAETVAAVPVVHAAPVAKAQVVESPAVSVGKAHVVESLGGKPIVVEKPVVAAPIVPVAPTTPTAPVAQVVETFVVEKPAIEKPVVEAPAAPSTPTAPAVPVVETLVVDKPVIASDTPVAPATPKAPVVPVVETIVVEKPVVEAPIAPAVPETPKAPVVQVVETLVVEKPVVETPIAPVATDSRPATIAEVPATTPATPVATPVVEAPIAPATPAATPAVEAPIASAAPAMPTAPVAQVAETFVVEKPVVASDTPVAPAAPTTATAPIVSAAPDSRPATVAEVPVTPATPVVEAPIAAAAPATPTAPVAQVVETVVGEKPVVEAPVAKSEVASAKPVVSGKRTAAPEDVVVIDLSQESARAVVPLHEAPFVAAAQQEIAAATASARTEAIVEVVNNVAEAIADQILVTPSLVRGEGQMIVRLKPEVLDGSEIRLSSESGTLAVEVVPSTPNAAKLATEAMPRLETALAEHVSTFRQVSVSVRKGKGNEVV